MKYIVNILAIIVIVVLVISVINYKNEPGNRIDIFLKKLWKGTVEFLKVQKHNIFTEITPKRNRPITLVEKETVLREFDPEVFGKFEDKDWDEFWEVIYGNIRKKQGKYSVLRQRDKEEIEALLIEKYPKPFLYLDKSYWNIFWENIIGITWVEEDK